MRKAPSDRIESTVGSVLRLQCLCSNAYLSPSRDALSGRLRPERTITDMRRIPGKFKVAVEDLSGVWSMIQPVIFSCANLGENKAPSQPLPSLDIRERTRDWIFV